MADSWNSFYKSCPDSLIPLKWGLETFDWLLCTKWGLRVVDWSSQSFPWIWLLPDYRNDSCVEFWKIACYAKKKKVVRHSVKFLQITQIIFLETLRRSFKKMIWRSWQQNNSYSKLMSENWWHDISLQNISCKCKKKCNCSVKKIWSLRISLLLLLLQGFVEEYKKELGRELQRGIKHFCDS